MTMAIPKTVSLRNVTLPTEHGGWGFLLEPIVLGLILAPSWAGLWLCLAAVAAFLTRHPMTLALADVRRGKTWPRTRVAARVAAAFGLTGAACMGMAFLTAQSAFWLPLLIAAPLAVVYLVQDARRKGRSLSGELTGALAMDMLVPAVAMAAGWSLQDAALPCGLLALRGVSSILFVRLQVRRLHGVPTSATSTVVVHLLGLVVVAGMVLAGRVPILAAVPYPLIAALHLAWLGRPARVGLCPPATGERGVTRSIPAGVSSARALGWTEAALGLFNVLLIGLGFRLG